MVKYQSRCNKQSNRSNQKRYGEFSKHTAAPAHNTLLGGTETQSGDLPE